MIGAVAVAGQGAAKVRTGECRDLIRNTHRDSGVVEVGKRIRDLRVQTGLGGELVVVGIKTAERNKEHLALGAQLRARRDHARDHPQLRGDAAGGQVRGQREIGRGHQRRGKHGVGGNRALRGFGEILRKDIASTAGDEIVERAAGTR